MTYREAKEVIVADTIESFCDQMCVSAQTVLEEIGDDNLQESIIEEYNDKRVEEEEPVKTLSEMSKEDVMHGLKTLLSGHTDTLYRDYLATLDHEYTVVKTPSGWDKIIKLKQTN